jgi:hypothetical protein
MCDEDGETHGEELYCVCVEDIAEIIKHAAAHEREACANVCEGIGWGNNPYVNPKAGTTCAAAIRSRGKNDCGGAQHHRYAGSFGG